MSFSRKGTAVHFFWYLNRCLSLPGCLPLLFSASISRSISCLPFIDWWNSKTDAAIGTTRFESISATFSARAETTSEKSGQVCPILLFPSLFITTYYRFKSTGNSVLLATDIAARGLDIPAVDHVIHYQIPRTADAYVHRNGRTARAMRRGFSMLMCAPDERRVVRALLGSLGRRKWRLLDCS